MDLAEPSEMGAAPSADRTVRLKKWPFLSRLLLPFGDPLNIVITGLRGTGKTVLYETLAGALDPSAGSTNSMAKPRERSADVEKHAVKLYQRRTKCKIVIRVIPGQLSSERILADDNTFGAGRAPVGVIHVVSWGHNRIWRTGQGQAMPRG